MLVVGLGKQDAGQAGRVAGEDNQASEQDVGVADRDVWAVDLGMLDAVVVDLEQQAAGREP